VLRASGRKDGEVYDLDSVVGRGEGDSGVAHGALLMAFTDAVFGDDDAALDRVRAELIETMGAAAFVDAAGTAASFNSVVRVADGTGIPIDEFKAADAQAVLDELGVEDFSTRPVV
jgi:hypothetical protein